jgi:hypothetical protein
MKTVVVIHLSKNTNAKQINLSIIFFIISQNSCMNTDTMLGHMKDLIDKHDLPKSFDQLKDRHSDQLKNIEKKLDELYQRPDRMEKKKSNHDTTHEPSHLEKESIPSNVPGLQTIKRSTRSVRRIAI